MIQHRSLIAMYKYPIHLDDEVLTTPELQLGLQTFFITIYLLVKGCFDPRQPTGGIIYQNLYLMLAQQLNFQGNYIITFYLIDSLCIVLFCIYIFCLFCVVIIICLCCMVFTFV